MARSLGLSCRGEVKAYREFSQLSHLFKHSRSDFDCILFSDLLGSRHNVVRDRSERGRGRSCLSDRESTDSLRLSEYWKNDVHWVRGLRLECRIDRSCLKVLVGTLHAVRRDDICKCIRKTFVCYCISICAIISSSRIWYNIMMKRTLPVAKYSAELFDAT